MKTTIKYLAVLFILILILTISWRKENISDRQGGPVSLQLPVDYSVFVIKNSDPDSIKKIVPPASDPSCKRTCRDFSGCSSRALDLTACRFIDAGDVSMAEDSGYFYITYKTTGGWSIGKIELYLGTKENIPLNLAGVPMTERFPVKETFSPQAETVILRITKNDRLEICPALIAHAIVSRSGQANESAWAGEKGMP